jgi:leader peptidase (prepilin peptidase)/N-methyltransferase
MNFFDLPRPFIYSCLFLIGSCIGSFLNVCIHRFPGKVRLRDQLRSLNSHRSGCPRCAASIRWRDNIPILGWLMLLGRCRSCRKPISPRYIFVEALTAVLFVVVYWYEMPTTFWSGIETSGLYDSRGPQQIREFWDQATWLHARYALHIFMICGLIVATFIDFELKIIPDGSTVPIMVAAFLTSIIVGQVHIVPLWFQDASVVRVVREVAADWMIPFLFEWDPEPFTQQWPRLHAFLVSLAGFVVGGGVVWIVRIIGQWILKQEAMGFGDVILMAMVGSVIGWQPVLVVFFTAPMFAVFGAAVAWLTQRERRIPYGPWLSLAALLLLVTWRQVWPVARTVFDMGPFLIWMGFFMVASLVVSLQLIQIVKRLLGIPLYPPDDEHEVPWTSADHLSYYNSERTDEQIGQWQRPVWPGCRTGRGLGQSHQWRTGGRN